MYHVYFANSNDEEFAFTGNERKLFVINQKESIFFSLISIILLLTAKTQWTINRQNKKVTAIFFVQTFEYSLLIFNCLAIENEKILEFLYNS